MMNGWTAVRWLTSPMRKVVSANQAVNAAGTTICVLSALGCGHTRK